MTLTQVYFVIPLISLPNSCGMLSSVSIRWRWHIQHGILYGWTGFKMHVCHPGHTKKVQWFFGQDKCTSGHPGSSIQQRRQRRYLCTRLLSVENIQRQAMVIVVMDSDEILDDEAIPEWLELAIICFQRYHSPWWAPPLVLTLCTYQDCYVTVTSLCINALLLVFCDVRLSCNVLLSLRSLAI